MEMTFDDALTVGRLLVDRSSDEVAVYRLLCPTLHNDTWVLNLTAFGQLMPKEACLNLTPRSDPVRDAIKDDALKSRLPILSTKIVRESKIQCTRVGREELLWRLHERELMPMEIEHTGAMVIHYDSLSEAARRTTDSRVEVMEEFLDPVQILRNFAVSDNFGPLVNRALRQLEKKGAKNARSYIYNLLRLLINFGFSATSLHAADHLRGAPGLLRPYGPGSSCVNEAVERKRPGRKTAAERAGYEDFETLYVPEEMRFAIVVFFKSQKRPGKKFTSLYYEMLCNLYAEKVEFQDGKFTYILPPPGHYPNVTQFRNIVTHGTDPLSRAKAETTPNHWKKNHRGLRGTARDGVLGPGHVYAIDSTAADIYLRSTINNDWIAGRPCVYWVIDVWSTAIVGFYIGFEYASWDAAKLALYVTFSDPAVLSELYGFEFPQTLWPRPLLPARLLSDRGEYLSKKAKKTTKALGFSTGYNTSYRADLRGTGERFHRTSKDADFKFVPGAFDARRKELEERPDCSLSVLNLPDYVKNKAYFAAGHNECADREGICPVDMIADGADMTPAGLWRWGMENGIGYRKEPQVNLEQLLLMQVPVRWRKNGPHFGSLRYEAPNHLLDLSAEARNFGVKDYSGYLLPGALNQMYVDVRGSCLDKIIMSPGGLVDSKSSIYDLSDAVNLKDREKRKQQHPRTEKKANWIEKQASVIHEAKNRIQNRFHRERDFFREGVSPQADSTPIEDPAPEPTSHLEDLISQLVAKDQSDD